GTSPRHRFVPLRTADPVNPPRLREPTQHRPPSGRTCVKRRIFVTDSDDELAEHLVIDSLKTCHSFERTCPSGDTSEKPDCTGLQRFREPRHNESRTANENKTEPVPTLFPPIKPHVERSTGFCQGGDGVKRFLCVEGMV